MSTCSKQHLLETQFSKNLKNTEADLKKTSLTKKTCSRYWSRPTIYNKILKKYSTAPETVQLTEFFFAAISTKTRGFSNKTLNVVAIKYVIC